MNSGPMATFFFVKTIQKIKIVAPKTKELMINIVRYITFEEIIRKCMKAQTYLKFFFD